MSQSSIGFGQPNYRIAIYLANRPPLDGYPQQTNLRSLKPGEIAYIAQATGNHWRKVFNVSAKFLYGLLEPAQASWQQYRDEALFREDCPAALLFSKPQLQQSDLVHIIAGKTYARDLGLHGLGFTDLFWLNEHFAISEQHKLIVCPYLDYRQLSNARIEQLIGLVQQLSQR